MDAKFSYFVWAWNAVYAWTEPQVQWGSIHSLSPVKTSIQERICELLGVAGALGEKVPIQLPIILNLSLYKFQIKSSRTERLLMGIVPAPRIFKVVVSYPPTLSEKWLTVTCHRVACTLDINVTELERNHMVQWSVLWKLIYLNKFKWRELLNS